MPLSIDQERELIGLLEAELTVLARKSFTHFRRKIRPKDKRGWWQREIEKELQEFFKDLQAGLRPTIIIEAPPQHGKSSMITDFIAWVAGQDPDLASIYASKAERLGIRANLYLQRLMDSDAYREIFPKTFLNGSNVVTQSGQHLRNREMLEFVGRIGSFRNVTIEGSVNGESLNLGVIDDPVKDRAAANSKTQRESVWDWFTDVFNTRMDETGGLIFIMTRWHLDDLVGRVREKYPNARVVSYPAIATEDEEHRKAGEALFPEHKSLQFILERKQAMAPANFSALYQQRPVLAGGEMIKEDWLEFYDELPEFSHLFMTGDTAQTVGPKSDYSVFQCWGRVVGSDKIALVDMIRGRWEYPELKSRAIDFFNWHKEKGVAVLRFLAVEHKSSGISLNQDLKKNTGIPIREIKRSRASKEDRLEDIMGHIASGRVLLPRNARFTNDLVGELIQFPNGPHDDQVDPLADAVNIELNQKRRQLEALKPMRVTHV